MRIISALILAFLLVAIPIQAGAEEQILSFESDIKVQTNGDLDVVETIKVISEGREIRRGIFRDIPLRALDKWGFWTRNGFEINEVLHNGEPSPYNTEWIGRFLRIYIGDADVFIPDGEHTYRISYTTTRQLRFFEGYDELYWNVTGNFWSFPIRNVVARVTLPEGTAVEQLAAYTGSFGAAGSDYEVSGREGSQPQFRSTRSFAAHEGMTIAVGFTKGAIAQSGTSEFFSNIFANLGAILFGIGWTLVPIYFLVVWWRIGRDPPGETIIPLYHPPEGLSPAALSYVHFKSFRQIGKGTDLAFIAALLSLGVKKLLVIDEDDKKKIRFQKGEGNGSPISSGERALFSKLFTGRDEVPLDKRYGKMLLSARSALHSAITREYGGKFFRKNIGWFVPGVIVAAVTLILGLILQGPPEQGLSAVIPTLFSSVFGWILLLIGWYRFTSPVPTILGRIAAILFMTVGLVLLLASLSTALFVTSLPIYRIAAMLLFLGAALIVAMFFLISAPTLEGAKVLSRIEGFKLYLETAEVNRLNMRDAPEMTEELYERYLPYAAGLGVEEPWSNAYSAHLARSARGTERSYQPAWYHGRSWRGDSLTQATASSMAAVSAAMASSMPQPKSSSGSSGGGFSGGGGGGGGGGGW
ncbi:MAG: DUF2207 domain-containing protein [Rhizobiaceae bacterium]